MSTQDSKQCTQAPWVTENAYDIISGGLHFIMELISTDFPSIKYLYDLFAHMQTRSYKMIGISHMQHDT